ARSAITRTSFSPGAARSAAATGSFAKGDATATTRNARAPTAPRRAARKPRTAPVTTRRPPDEVRIHPSRSRRPLRQLHAAERRGSRYRRVGHRGARSSNAGRGRAARRGRLPSRLPRSDGKPALDFLPQGAILEGAVRAVPRAEGDPMIDLDMTETTRIANVPMQEMVFGRPAPRRFRFPSRLIFVAALAAMSVG